MTAIILISVCVGVTALVFAVASLFVRTGAAVAESRLHALAQAGNVSLAEMLGEGDSLLANPRPETERFKAIERAVARFLNLRLFIEQSGVKVAAGKVILLTLLIGGGGFMLGTLLPLPYIFAPLFALLFGIGPLLWLAVKRYLRLSAFERQLPDAMDLLARSLRAGHGLADGINLIRDEMPEPISGEFGRCYERQNLGLRLEDALEEMTVRVPNPDLRFFATAISLQRQTGGDAAEVLDKIGHLIRERFGIRGQIKALTGEGRLSGLVLIALPIVLAIYMYVRNPEYLRVLFTDPIGQKMLAGAVVSQILGTLVIKKIVDIKV